MSNVVHSMHLWNNLYQENAIKKKQWKENDPKQDSQTRLR
jgi:hypothetical protein